MHKTQAMYLVEGIAPRVPCEPKREETMSSNGCIAPASTVEARGTMAPSDIAHKAL